MKVYDTVNRLAEEIKESEEYINFKKAKEAINTNKEYENKISEFNKLRYEEQLNSMQTGRADEEKIKIIQEKYTELISIPDIAKYFDAEFKFNVMLGDVNKIISEAVKDVI